LRFTAVVVSKNTHKRTHRARLRRELGEVVGAGGEHRRAVGNNVPCGSVISVEVREGLARELRPPRGGCQRKVRRRMLSARAESGARVTSIAQHVSAAFHLNGARHVPSKVTASNARVFQRHLPLASERKSHRTCFRHARERRLLEPLRVVHDRALAECGDSAHAGSQHGAGQRAAEGARCAPVNQTKRKTMHDNDKNREIKSVRTPLSLQRG
jgi:hypothetical protein